MQLFAKTFCLVAALGVEKKTWSDKKSKFIQLLENIYIEQDHYSSNKNIIYSPLADLDGFTSHILFVGSTAPKKKQHQFDIHSKQLHSF